MKRIGSFCRSNVVPIVFSLLCILSIYFAKQMPSYIVSETFSRVTRNSVLILSLIFPVLCGMGLNFSIVLGAMAGEVGLILITHWKMNGVPALLLAMFIGTVTAIVLGYLTGRLFNKVKGQEMIAGLILGFFAIGVYDLTFMILVGGIIPFNDPEMMVAVTQADGTVKYVGLAISLNLKDTVKYAFDNFLSFKLIDGLPYMAGFSAAAGAVIFAVKKFVKKLELRECLRTSIALIVIAVLLAVLKLLVKSNKAVYSALFTLKFTTGSWMLIVLVCLVTTYITKTKLGQDIRAVGQSMTVSSAAGINVDRTRIIATILSTVVAAWGQIIYLQNIGTIQTYYSHEQVGTYAVAAILVGGASIEKATIKHVFVGALLFHILFFTTPLAATAIFNDAQLGEYFRVFLCYGVIAASLLLFALRKHAEYKRKLTEEFHQTSIKRA